MVIVVGMGMGMVVALVTAMVMGMVVALVTAMEMVAVMVVVMVMVMVMAMVIMTFTLKGFFGNVCAQSLLLHSDWAHTQKLQTQALDNGTLLRHFFIAVNGEKALRARKQVGSNAKAIVLEW